MYSIGQFSQLTGLSVKALRHYDAEGLLVPADVDPWSAYRRYDGSQIRDAATICVLRAMDLPLVTVREALADPSRVDEIVDAFVAEREERRRREDQITADARRALAGYAAPTTPQRRHADAQPWVGLVCRISLEDVDVDERSAAFNERFNEFYRRAHDAGLEPLGHWWMTSDDTGDSSELECTWGIPVRHLPDGPLTDDPDERSGTLPARTEVYTELEVDDSEADRLLEAPHPLVVAFLGAGLEPDVDVRQVHIPGPDSFRLQVVADLP
ncbi:hypothetical protein GCM10027418_16060 [Mariniluteicoccus endophyticus]